MNETTTIERIAYNQREAAEALGVSVVTLRKWDRAGAIKGARPGDGVVLYARTELERLVNDRKGAPCQH